jgi:hypothetical protein
MTHRFTRWGRLLLAVSVAAAVLTCGEKEDGDDHDSDNPAGPSLHAVAVAVPGTGTEWHGGVCCDTVSWSEAFGDSVQIRVYSDSMLLEYPPSWVANTGSYVMEDQVPTGWESGSRYQVQIIDERGNVGWSDTFSVVADPFATIEVTSPTSATKWRPGQFAGSIAWTLGAGGGDSVQFEVYRNWTYVGRFSTKVLNGAGIGGYTLNERVDYDWGSGARFRLRIVDNQGFYGWSAPFAIQDDSCSRIAVSTPDTGTTWLSGHSGMVVNWTRYCGDVVKLELRKAGSPLDTLSSWISNSGQYTRAEIVDPAWGTGEDFQVRVIDKCGSFGYSPKFAIATDPLNVLALRTPTQKTVWYVGQKSVRIEWRDTLADSMSVILLRNGLVQGQLLPMTASSGGTSVMIDSLASTRGYGSGYSIKIVDNIGRFGLSNEFVIDSSGTIKILTPNKGTVWLHGDANRTLSINGSQADSFYLALYVGKSTFIDTVVKLRPVSGSTALDSVKAGWGVGTSFRLKAVDNDGNYGWSEQFSIRADTLPSIRVMKPDSATTWVHGQDSAMVRFALPDSDTTVGSMLGFGLYRLSSSGLSLDTNFSMSGPFDSIVYYPGSIPSSLAVGTYRIKVYDTRFHFGWSQPFHIKADLMDRIIVIAPDTTTVWYTGETGQAISWSGSASDSAAVVLVRWGMVVDTVVGWDVDSGHATRISAVPTAWGTGTGFRVKVIDNQGSFGLSDSFEINGDSLNRIVVTVPNGTSFWRSGRQDSTYVVRWTGLRPDSVHVDLYRGNTYIAPVTDFAGDTLNSAPVLDTIPTSWGTGSNYRVRVTDPVGHYGLSEEFRIR